MTALPSTTDSHGRTRYEHAFLVNTTVLLLDSPTFMPTECFGLFELCNVLPQRGKDDTVVYPSLASHS